MIAKDVVMQKVDNVTISNKLSFTLNFIIQYYDWDLNEFWELCYLHPVRMFLDCVWKYLFDESLLQWILLHDIIEHTGIKVSELVDIFGWDVGFLVNGMTKYSLNQWDDYIEKFKLYINKNRRILFIKIFDCIDNLKNMNWFLLEDHIKYRLKAKYLYLPILQEKRNQIPSLYNRVFWLLLNELENLLMNS